MNILSKIFKKRQHSKKYFKVSDTPNIVIKTNKKISDAQRDAICTIVKEAYATNDLHKIAIKLIMDVGIHDAILINSYDDSIEIVF